MWDYCVNVTSYYLSQMSKFGTLRLLLALALFSNTRNIIATTATTKSLTYLPSGTKRLEDAQFHSSKFAVFEALPDSTGTITGLASVPTYMPSSNGTISGICIYTVTGDMYGLGVRLGFYLQSATGIIATVFIPDEGEQGRANSAILCFALLIAFSFDIQSL
jgi:hypothetical protein